MAFILSNILMKSGCPFLNFITVTDYKKLPALAPCVANSATSLGSILKPTKCMAMTKKQKQCTLNPKAKFGGMAFCLNHAEKQTYGLTCDSPMSLFCSKLPPPAQEEEVCRPHKGFLQKVGIFAESMDFCRK